MLVFRTSKSVTENTTRVHWNVACVAGLKRGRGGRVREQGSKEGGLGERKGCDGNQHSVVKRW